jgi:hypothetical protein
VLPQSLLDPQKLIDGRLAIAVVNVPLNQLAAARACHACYWLNPVGQDMSHVTFCIAP